MAVEIEGIVERAFEQAFTRALVQALQAKFEAMFKQALQPGSPFAQRLEEKITQGFERFMTDGIRWEKKKPGFRK